MSEPAEPQGFPRAADFAPMHVVHLDAAFTHPISLGARETLEGYLDLRMKGPSAGGHDVGATREAVLGQFARLIGAGSDEVSLAPSTMAGENLVIAALGLTGGSLGGGGGRIVTDALHFPGSLYLYEQLARRGVEVVVLRPKAGAIPLEDIAAALETPTDLVALSLVSNYNGFRHDLDAVCGLAHARGVPVYADIIQAAGAVPFDVRTSGVDFAACASYKWLMGDFGVGFLYARRDRLAGLDAAAFGYRQVSGLSAHPEEDPPVRWRERDDATGAFGMGTSANGVVAMLQHSLAYIEDLGVEAIMAHRDGLLARLREGLARRGVAILTPDGGATPILTFAPDDAARAAERLAAAGVFVTTYDNRVRVAPSVYNGPDDIDRLLEALP